MNKEECLELMQSDMKLWDTATTVADGNDITKTLELPWGIGEVTVTLEGLTDAGKRRSAVASYGEYIRGIIDEQINDEAVTARAQQAAALASPPPSELPDGGGTDRPGPGGSVAVGAAPLPDTQAVAAYDGVISGPEAVHRRIDDLGRAISEGEQNIARMRREQTGLAAYVDAMYQGESDAPEDITSESGSEEEETTVQGTFNTE